MFQQGSDYISRSITNHGQMRRLPHQGARHSTVDHGDASDGVFILLHLWVLPSRWLTFLLRSPSSLSLSLSLACGWPPGANGSASRTLGLKILRVQGKGGTDPGVGQASRLGPTGPGPSRPGSVAPSLPWVLRDYALCPFHLHDFDDVILTSKMEVLRA
jgi:hypothetical protein